MAVKIMAHENREPTGSLHEAACLTICPTLPSHTGPEPLKSLLFCSHIGEATTAQGTVRLLGRTLSVVVKAADVQSFVAKLQKT